MIQKIRNEKPDSVLLDVMMPGMNGFEVCRRLKDQASNEDPIRVVMFTVLKSDLDRRVAEESGCDGYLVKPFAPEDLIGEVAKYLRKSS
jgi:two-component system alkaline phosphatase synthesis response regulator PhoP